MTPEQIKVLKESICFGLTDEQLEYFLQVAKSRGLSPFAGQILPILRNTWNPDLKRKVPKLTIQATINGFRSIAAQTGKYQGQEGPFYCGEDGEWRDSWLSKTPPAAAKVLVYREGFAKPLSRVALWSEYAQTFKDPQTNKEKLQGLWASHSTVMLGKCAEAQALRAAFPEELGGIYSDDEKETTEEEPAGYKAFGERTAPEERQLETSTTSSAEVVAEFVEATEPVKAKAVEKAKAASTKAKAKEHALDVQPVNTQKAPRTASATLREFRHAINNCADVDGLQAVCEGWNSTIEELPPRIRDLPKWYASAAKKKLEGVEPNDDEKTALKKMAEIGD